MIFFQFKDIMDSIEYFETQIGRREVFGPAEADPEYKVIVDANNIIVEIDNEISSYMLSFFVQFQTAITALMFLDIVHKYVKDIYNKRFPELESLVQMPLEYIRTVKVSPMLYIVRFFYKI